MPAADQILIPPITTPAIPTAIANNRKFFFLAMDIVSVFDFKYVSYSEFRIDNVPRIASSSLTVSVA